MRCAWSAAAYFTVRLLVVKTGLGYREVSGVGLEQVSRNLREPDSFPLFLLTAGALIPFLALGWSTTAASLKRMALFLLPVLLVSSLFFSWLVETRNFMPLVFVLAVVAGGFLCRAFPATEV